MTATRIKIISAASQRAEEEFRLFPEQRQLVAHLFSERITPSEIREFVREHMKPGSGWGPLSGGAILTVLENYWDDLRQSADGIPAHVPSVDAVLALMAAPQGWTQAEAVAMLGGKN